MRYATPYQDCNAPQSGNACRPCSYIICVERDTLLIPSGYKSKIPSTLSWPIKAQELSAAIAGVPQFDLLKLNFSFYNSDRDALGWASSWITLLRVVYSRHDRGFSPSRAMEESGWHNKSWSIIIAPTPRSEAKVAHDHLLPALPKVAAWLTRNSDLQTIGTNQYVWSGRRRQMKCICPQIRHWSRRGSLADRPFAR